MSELTRRKPRKEGGAPLKEHKPDTARRTDTADAALQDCIDRQRLRERQLLPLRVNAQTVIYVPRQKCTPEHIDHWLRQHGQRPAKKGGRE